MKWCPWFVSILGSRRAFCSSATASTSTTACVATPSTRRSSASATIRSTNSFRPRLPRKFLCVPWQHTAHSITCALAAESIAEQTNVDRNIAYTVGLLHSIGMVVIDDWAVRNRPEIRFGQRTLPLEACEAERAKLGFHQAEAGAALLRSWDFPPAMLEPVRWQYLPNGTAAHFPLAALLHVAKWLRAT